MPSPTLEDAMVDFILAGGKNFHTALLAHTAFPRVAEKLISSFARRVERTLAEEPGWKVISNTLASSPRERWVELKWAPIEWEKFGWGICLSPERTNARDFIFGIFGVDAASPDPEYLKNPGRYPAMPDADRTRLKDAIVPLLNSIGTGSGTTVWWPRWAYLRTVRNWMEPATLMKIAAANGISDEQDLVSGKPMDVFIVDLFRAAKEAIADLPGLRDIRPASG